MRKFHITNILFAVILIFTFSAVNAIGDDKISKGKLSGFGDVLVDSTAGANSIHTISFNGENGLPPGGKFHFDFQQGFDFGNLNSINIKVGDSLYNNYIQGYNINNQTLSIIMKTDSPPIDPNSLIIITLDYLVNDTIAGSHFLVGWTTTALDSLIDGPSVSQIFDIIPSAVDHIEITPAGDMEILAGEYVNFDATAFDEYGNEVGGLDFEWSVEPDSCGDIYNGFFMADKVGVCHIYASYGETIGVSGDITVIPGEFGNVNFYNIPISSVAGRSFPDSIGVEILDVKGNHKTDFQGEIYFTSTADSEYFYYNQNHPYNFTLSDSGFRYFSGDGFILFTSGLQNVLFNYESQSIQSTAVLVSPADVANFIISCDLDSIVAGEAFELGVNGAVDSFGNLVSGLIIVEGVEGVHPSPWGAVPILNNINVSDGEGYALQYLYATDTVLIELSSGYYADTTQPFFVHPSNYAKTSVSINSPQSCGIPFTEPSEIIAYDGFGNVKIDMDASQNEIRLDAMGATDIIENNIFNQSSDFVDGICDLYSHYTTLWGESGYKRLMAVSDVDTSYSNSFYYLSLLLDYLHLGEEYFFFDDSVSAIMQLSNNTDRAVIVDSTILVPKDEVNHYFCNSEPSFPFSINAGETKKFNLSFYVPFHPGGVSEPLNIDIFSHTDTIAIFNKTFNFPDTAHFAVRDLVNSFSNSLHPDTVTLGQVYSFALTVADTFYIGINLYDSSKVVIQDTLGHLYESNLSSDTYLPPNAEQVELNFDPKAINEDLLPGSYHPSLVLYGGVMGYPYIDSLQALDFLFITDRSSLSYISNTLNPDSVVINSSVPFQLEIASIDGVTLELNPDSTNFVFGGGENPFRAVLDTADGFPNEIPPNDTVLLHFVSSVVSDSLEIGDYAPTLRLFGLENGVEIDESIGLKNDSVSVFSPGYIVIDSTHISSPNAPKVDIGQNFFFSGIFRNMGSEPVRNIIAGLSSDGGSEYPDSIIVDLLPGLSEINFDYPVAADSVSGFEVFELSPVSATGDISGNEVDIEVAHNQGTRIVEKQLPASVGIIGLEVFNVTPDVDTVTAGERFTLNAIVFKNGEADISGDMALQLDLSSAPDFALIGPARQEFDIIDNPIDTVFWDIYAADIDTVGEFVINTKFDGDIIDVNDSSNAIGVDSTANIRIVVIQPIGVSSSLRIVNPFGATDGVLSTGELFTVSDSIAFDGGVSDPTATIELPEGYITTDPITKDIGLQPVNWQLYSPDEPDVNIKNVIVGISGIDPYSGDSISVTDKLEVLTVEAAELIPQFYVLAPNSATDLVLDPSQEITLSFSCENIGQAGTYPGEVKIYKPADFELLSNQSRIFDIGEPVSFDIRAPAYELLNPASVWVRITNVPNDSNTNKGAHIVADSLSIQFLVKDLKPDLILEGYDGFSGQGIAGTEINGLKLYFYNNDNGSGYPIVLTYFQLWAYGVNGGEIGFNTFAQQIRLLTSSGSEASGSISDTTAVFDNINDISIPPGGMDTLTFVIKIKDSINLPGFSLGINSGDLEAYAVRDGVPQIKVGVKTASGDSLKLRTKPAGLSIGNLKESFGNYPNPFNPLRQTTIFSYYLPIQSDVSLTIYTLTGKPVWNVEFKGSDEHCLQGNHSGQSTLAPIEWDGRNGNGYTVNNAVYIAILKLASTGEAVKTKVAVVK